MPQAAIPVITAVMHTTLLFHIPDLSKLADGRILWTL
jgi:hypothetical protein